MPSSRRMRVVGLIAVLTVLTILYVSGGAKSTYESPFYTRTVDAIKVRQDAEAHQHIIAAEQERKEKMERIEKEHDAAVAKAAADAAAKHDKHEHDKHGMHDTMAHVPEAQKPLEEDDDDSTTKTEKASPKHSEKSVAGRKKMKDDRKVESAPARDNDNGVAKVGNVEPKASVALKTSHPSAETKEDVRVAEEMNSILKKGPIIIFSKSYCPYSKKAKHILLDLYTITPKPYVVELDQHDLGMRLQDSLLKTTGRRTVPNVLISGMSIGGGDDIAKLHHEGKLAETISSMGGKRIMEVTVNDPSERQPHAKRFKA